MTVRLLQNYGAQPAGTLYTVDSATEASLVVAGIATSNTSGGVTWDPPTGDPGVGPEADELTVGQAAVVRALVSGDGTALMTAAQVSANATKFIAAKDDGTPIKPDGTALGNVRVQKIKQALAGAAYGDRRTNVPWTVPPAYQSSTVYGIGNAVTNGGHIYIATSSGTSGASSAPTATVPSLITDGTVKWQWRGPLAYSNDIAAPSISISSSAPSSPARAYRNAASTDSTGATTVISNDSWFRTVGHLARLLTTGISNGNYSGVARNGVEFMTDAMTVTIWRSANLGNKDSVSVAVDERYMTYGSYLDVTSSTEYITLTFQTRKARKIGLYWNNPFFAGVRAVYVNSWAECWKPTGSRYDAKVMVVQDSFGSTGYNNVGHDWIAARQAYGRLGFGDVFVDYVGGSGFVAGYQQATDPFGVQARLDRIAEYMPDVLHVSCSYNDASGVATVGAAYSAWHAAARAIVGDDVPIIVSGVLYNSSGEHVVDAAVRTAMSSINDPRAYWIPTTADPQGQWMTGTGDINTPTGSGNADVYVLGGHPTQYGQDYLADRLASAVYPVLSAIV